MTLLWQCEKQVDSCGNGGEADEAPCPLRSGHLGTCCGNQSQPFLAVAHRNPLKLLGTLIRTESNLMSSLSPGRVYNTVVGQRNADQGNHNIINSAALMWPTQ
ncbi:unnamed protein product [Leuciscus chuanchicus]